MFIYKFFLSVIENIIF